MKRKIIALAMAVVRTIFTAKSITFADNFAKGASENDGYNYIAY